jgi:hypothetical protein
MIGLIIPSLKWRSRSFMTISWLTHFRRRTMLDLVWNSSFKYREGMPRWWRLTNRVMRYTAVYSRTSWTTVTVSTHNDRRTMGLLVMADWAFRVGRAGRKRIRILNLRWGQIVLRGINTIVWLKITRRCSRRAKTVCWIKCLRAIMGRLLSINGLANSNCATQLEPRTQNS